MEAYESEKQRVIRAFQLYAMATGGLSECSLAAPASLEEENTLDPLRTFTALLGNFCVTWSGHNPELNALIGALDVWQSCMDVAGYHCCQVATTAMHRETTVAQKELMAREIWARAFLENVFARVMDGVETEGHLDVRDELVARRLITHDACDAMQQTAMRLA